MNVENNYMKPMMMSKVIRGNISYLTRLSNNAPEGESRDRIKTLIDLCATRKLTQLTTVEKIIVAYIATNNAKQRVAVHTTFDKIIEIQRCKTTSSENSHNKESQRRIYKDSF